MLGSQAHITMPNILSEFWGIKLRSSAFKASSLLDEALQLNFTASREPHLSSYWFRTEKSMALPHPLYEGLERGTSKSQLSSGLSRETVRTFPGSNQAPQGAYSQGTLFLYDHSVRDFMFYFSYVYILAPRRVSARPFPQCSVTLCS